MLRLRFAIGIFLAANGTVEAMAQQCDLSGRSIFYRSKYCVSTLCYNTSVTPFGSVTLEGAKGIDKSNYATFGAGGGVSVGFTFTNAKKISDLQGMDTSHNIGLGLLSVSWSKSPIKRSVVGEFRHWIEASSIVQPVSSNDED